MYIKLRGSIHVQDGLCVLGVGRTNVLIVLFFINTKYVRVDNRKIMDNNFWMEMIVQQRFFFICIQKNKKIEKPTDHQVFKHF